MKKILISITGFIILILIIVSATKGIKVSKFSVYSVNNIKAAGEDLDKKIEEAKVEQEQNYTKAVSDINNSVKSLKSTKEEYEEKINSLGLNSELGITQIEKYKIEYLWNKIGSYAKKEGIGIDLDIQETTISETYSINFTLTGSYVGITDFLYDIENDDELNYKVKNFKIEPTVNIITSTSGQSTENPDTTVLKANFTVENIIINFN